MAQNISQTNSEYLLLLPRVVLFLCVGTGHGLLESFLQLEILSPDRPNPLFLLSREMYDSKITAFKENPFVSLTVTNGAL